PEPLPDPTGTLTAESIAHVVAFLLPDNAIVVDEAISSAEPLGRHLLRAAPHDFLPVTGGSIGQGMPVAVGAAVACPDRAVIAMEADGSAMYTLQALWTMARERLNVVTIVYNNRRYQILDVEMQRTGANGFGPAANTMIDIGHPDIDFVKLSEGLGVPATRATTVGALATQLADALRRPGPRLIEAVL
ncbi:MAG: thiamine pyrophosphate-dependent enzyme, partial [Bryobacteraceae bacterium]|nr:thiamine pyrophosphate-dependent enzyme [Bryobacteraceae bacterium]